MSGDSRERPFANLDDLRAYALRMVRLWDRDIARPFTMKAEFAGGNGPLIWALANHTVELGRVVFAARDARLLVLMPQIRVMMDCAITAAWATVQPGAVGAMVFETSRQRRATIKEIVERHGSNGLTQADLDSAIEDLEEFAPSRMLEAQYAEKKFKSMVGGADLYSSYRIASMFAHATTDLADMYLSHVGVSDSTPLGVAFNPDGDIEEREAWLGTALSMLVLSLAAVDATDGEGRFKAQIRKAKKQLMVTMPMELVDLNPKVESE